MNSLILFKTMDKNIKTIFNPIENLEADNSLNSTSHDTKAPNELNDINKNSQPDDSKATNKLNKLKHIKKQSLKQREKRQRKQNKYHNIPKLIISYKGDIHEVSKTNNFLLSLKEIKDLIKDNKNLKLIAGKDKVKFKRKYINFIISNYFAFTEQKINNQSCYDEHYKKLLITVLNKLKEIIEVNNCSYKVYFLINSKDIKNEIIKLIIEEANKILSECEHPTDILKDLFENLPEQFYTFSDKLKELKIELNMTGENYFTKELNYIVIDPCILANPWKEKMPIMSIKTFCNELQEKFLPNTKKNIEIKENKRQNIGIIKKSKLNIGIIENIFNEENIGNGMKNLENIEFKEIKEIILKSK